jgi:hypothetical protein
MQSTIRSKAILCFAGADEVPEGDLVAAASREAGLVRRSAPGEFEVRFASRLTDQELLELWAGTEDLHLEATPDSGFELSDYQVADYPPAPYQAAIVAAAPPGRMDELIGSFRGIGARLGDVYNLGASAAIAGTEETILVGEGSIVYLNHVRRPPTQAIEDFHAYWRLEHTKLSTRIPHFRGYRQVHAVAESSQALGAASGLLECDFDGTAEGYAYDINDLITMWHWEVEHKLYEDEAQFTDLPKCVMGYFRVQKEDADG